MPRLTTSTRNLVIFLVLLTACHQAVGLLSETTAATVNTPEILPFRSQISPLTTLVHSTSSKMSPQKSDTVRLVSRLPARLEKRAVNTTNTAGSFQCPEPLVRDPLYPNESSNAIFCQSGCCLPCPHHYYLYAPGELTLGFRLTTLLRSISAVLAAVILFSYLVLPKKRDHPARIILYASLAIFIFSAAGFFSLANPERVQCSDRFNESTQKTNNYCAVQGAVLVFGAHATAAWLAALILNLHLHTVWSLNWMRHHNTLVQWICWGLPTGLTLLTISMNAIRYEFGELCMVTQSIADPLFFYPLAAVVGPAFLVHSWTVVYIGRVTARSYGNGHDDNTRQRYRRRSSMGRVVVALTIQWRALAIAICLLVSFIFFWMFYFFEMTRLRQVSSTPTLLAPWSFCFLTGASNQAVCAAKIASELPTASFMIAAEAVVSSMGAVFFCIFALQKQFFLDWKELLSSLRENVKSRAVDSEPGLDSMDLAENRNVSARRQQRLQQARTLGMTGVALPRNPVELGAIYNPRPHTAGDDWVFYY